MNNPEVIEEVECDGGVVMNDGISSLVSNYLFQSDKQKKKKASTQ